MNFRFRNQHDIIIVFLRNGSFYRGKTVRFGGPEDFATGFPYVATKQPS